MTTRSCVTPRKNFIYGIHKPTYTTANLRSKTRISALGHLDSGTVFSNQANFPNGDIEVHDADWIFEIPNPFSFRDQPLLIKNGLIPVQRILSEFVFHHQKPFRSATFFVKNKCLISYLINFHLPCISPWPQHQTILKI